MKISKKNKNFFGNSKVKKFKNLIFENFIQFKIYIKLKINL